jgi:uncharacterized protein YcnI
MRSKMAILFTLLSAASPSSAHVTLADPSAPAGSTQVERFRVGHGCSGSPTTALRIEFPQGIVSAKPQPKPGWIVDIEHVGERVSAITWKGGALASDMFEDFVVLIKLPAEPGTLLFPATQTCESGVENWIAPPDGHPKNPAPMLNVTAPNSRAMPGMDMGGMHHGM